MHFSIRIFVRVPVGKPTYTHIYILCEISIEQPSVGLASLAQLCFILNLFIPVTRCVCYSFSEKILFKIICAASLVLVVGVFLVQLPLQRTSKKSMSLPPSKKIVGRERDVKELLGIIDFLNNSFHIFNIVGPPGFGKSALAIKVGNEILAQGDSVYYTDLADFPKQNFKEVLAQKILMEIHGYKKEMTITFDALLMWINDRWCNTLIILDNCDEFINYQKETFQNAMEKLLHYSRSNFKILTTSREVLWHSDAHYVHRINNIDMESSCQLLHNRNPSLLNESEKRTISELTGQVPLALQIVGALLNNKITPPAALIDSLRKHLIPTLSPKKLPSSLQLNASIFISYNFLDDRLQEIGRYLTHLPGSFDQHTAVGIVNLIYQFKGQIYQFKGHTIEDHVNSIEKLVELSLLEFDLKSKRYHYHKLIGEFFYTRSIVLELIIFYNAFQNFYSNELCKLANEFITSPKEALYQLDLNWHNVKLFLNILVTRTEGFTFDHDSFNCLFVALNTRYLSCRITPSEMIVIVQNLTAYVEAFIYWNLLIVDTELNISREFTIYVKLIGHVISIKQELGESQQALKVLKEKMIIVRLVCKFLPDTDIACRDAFSLVLQYEDNLDAEEAKEYHESFLKLSEGSQFTCKTDEASVCDYLDIGMSYYHLKDFNQTSKFFEKALADNTNLYPLFDRMGLLFWLKRYLNNDVKLKKIQENLLELYDSVLNQTSSQLYISKTTLKEYLEYLIDIGEQCKAYGIQEKWIHAMNEIKVETKEEDVQLAMCNALSLFVAGEYYRSIDVTEHAMDTAKNESMVLLYIGLNIIKGKAFYMVNNLTESEAALVIAMESLLANNMTSVTHANFSEVCWHLILLGNVNYTYECYTYKIIKTLSFSAELVLCILFKSPLDTSVERLMKSDMVDQFLERFPPLNQQSRKTDILFNDMMRLFPWRDNLPKMFISVMEDLCNILIKLFMHMFEQSLVKFGVIFFSILLRLLILRASFQLTWYILRTFYKLGRDVGVILFSILLRLLILRASFQLTWYILRTFYKLGRDVLYPFFILVLYFLFMTSSVSPYNTFIALFLLFASAADGINAYTGNDNVMLLISVAVFVRLYFYLFIFGSK